MDYSEMGEEIVANHSQAEADHPIGQVRPDVVESCPTDRYEGSQQEQNERGERDCCGHDASKPNHLKGQEIH